AISVTSTCDLTPCAIELVTEAVDSMAIANCWPPLPGSDGRALVALLASRHTEASYAAIGRLLGVTGRGVLYLIRLSEERTKADTSFAALVLEGERRMRMAR